jgi:hypothetical protein
VLSSIWHSYVGWAVACVFWGYGALTADAVVDLLSSDVTWTALRMLPRFSAPRLCRSMWHWLVNTSSDCMLEPCQLSFCSTIRSNVAP